MRRIPAGRIFADLGGAADGMLLHAQALIDAERRPRRPAPSTIGSSADGPPPAASRGRLEHRLELLGDPVGLVGAAKRRKLGGSRIRSALRAGPKLYSGGAIEWLVVAQISQASTICGRWLWQKSRNARTIVDW